MSEATKPDSAMDREDTENKTCSCEAETPEKECDGPGGAEEKETDGKQGEKQEAPDGGDSAEAEDAQSEEAASSDDSDDKQEGEEPGAGSGDSDEEEGYKDKYLRMAADFQNYKRRIEKERESIHAFANEEIITELLGVMDNFERALEHADDDGFKEGMKLIFDQLKGVLERFGVKEIEAENQVFDPNLHNAVMMEDAEEVESGSISEVLQKGYTLNGKVIRASMVKVAK